MRHSSGRGQTEPLAAIAAVAVVALALALYGTAVQGVAETGPERDRAGALLDEARAAACAAGTLRPAELPAAADLGPAGWRANLTVRTAGLALTDGPAPPPGADTAATLVPVWLGPGTTAPGRLEVTVWR